MSLPAPTYFELTTYRTRKVAERKAAARVADGQDARVTVRPGVYGNGADGYALEVKR